MTHSRAILEKEVAWNGIRFVAPVDWEIGKIGHQYLLLENGSKPVMEVKWRRIKGGFSARAQLQRLKALHKKIGVTIKEIPVPPLWKETVEYYQSACFSWRNEAVEGIGIVLYCDKCQTSTLMQFFQQKARITEKISTRLLTSFQDHPEDGQMAWTIFDVTARIPEYFKLDGYRFEPGAFALAFARKKQNIKLYRWGPAAILLRNRNLLQAAGDMLEIPQENLQYQKIDGHDAINANLYPGSDGRSPIRRLVRLGHGYCKARLWHLKAKNRLLGVKVDGKQPVDLHLFEAVCGHFNCL